MTCYCWITAFPYKCAKVNEISTSCCKLFSKESFPTWWWHWWQFLNENKTRLDQWLSFFMLTFTNFTVQVVYIGGKMIYHKMLNIFKKKSFLKCFNFNEILNETEWSFPNWFLSLCLSLRLERSIKFEARYSIPDKFLDLN